MFLKKNEPPPSPPEINKEPLDSSSRGSFLSFVGIQPTNRMFDIIHSPADLFDILSTTKNATIVLIIYLINSDILELPKIFTR
jgi:hypothetical protein